MNPLFIRLFDDAAIFPPGNVPLGAAVAAHRARRSDMTGPFVCSLARWDELTAVLGDGPPLAVAVVLPGPEASVPVAPGVDVVAVEGPDLIAARGALPTYAEMPLHAISVPRLAALRDARVRLKLRTGGVRADAFPTEKDLAAALLAAVQERVAFKLTAGLHDPVRHRDPVTGFEHHGFLNVLVATAHAVQGGDVAEIASALCDQDPDRVAAAITTIDASLAAQVRRCFVSFGTCSIEEPVDGLLRLGLIPEGTR